MEQKERRVSRERKEIEGRWDYPELQVWTADLGHRVLQDQSESQAQRDQRARGAAKATWG